MKRVWMAAAILAAGLAATAQAQVEYVLQYKHPKAGEAAVLHNVNHVVGTLGMGLGTMNMTQKTQQWMKIECLEVDEQGIATIRATFDRFVINMDMGAQHISFDTAAAPTTKPAKQDPAQEMVQKMMGGLFVGKSLTATVTPEGKCLKLEGIDEIFDGMKEMPGGEQMVKMLKEAMTQNMQEQWFGNTNWLPTAPVRIGEVWSSQQRMKMGPLGEVIAKTRNKLLGVEAVNGRRIARIGQTMNMELAPDVAGMKVPGAENMKVRIISQGGTGTLLWDMDKARVIKMRQSAPMEMGVEFGGAATQPSPSVKMTQKLDYTVMLEVEGDDVAAKMLPAETPEPAQPAGAAAERTKPASQPAAAK